MLVCLFHCMGNVMRWCCILPWVSVPCACAVPSETGRVQNWGPYKEQSNCGCMHGF